VQSLYLVCGVAGQQELGGGGGGGWGGGGVWGVN
jgi:hypothetical protein